MKRLDYIVAAVLMLSSYSRCDMCYYTAYTTQRSSTRCGFWYWGRCNRYRSVSVAKSKCCNGWTGPSCTIASDCPAISNCLVKHCNSRSDSICETCYGVVKDEYGWYAYTNLYPGDNQKICRRVCSWRSGSRCYPGICTDNTTSSCNCTNGFIGPDCNTITENPYILQNFLKLTERTDTSANHVESPANSNKGAPQDTTWTNNVRLQEFTAHVEANYQKILPDTPKDFYVNKEQTKIGIINGGIRLEWIRGSSHVARMISEECPKEPMPNNYHCEVTNTFESYNWRGNFQHKDLLNFTVFATNGGYVSVYDRENNSRIDRYDVSGKTESNVFEIRFDTEEPDHCMIENLNCISQPLVVPDVTTQDRIFVGWSGWKDATSGINFYSFEVFELQVYGAGTESELIDGDKVDAKITQAPPSASQTTAILPEPGSYAFTISTYDKAGNHRSARRLVIYDDNSTVVRQGHKSIKADHKGICTWTTSPSPPLVTSADPNANCDWITSQTSSVSVAWRERFINMKHHTGKWLNPVKAVNSVEPELDDNEGLRTTRKVDNVLGIVAFQVAYNVTFAQETRQYDFIEVDNIYTESFTFAENVSDGMRMDILIRALDIFGSFADDVIKVKVDTSPLVIEQLWLTRGDRKNISVHNLEDLTKLQMEWKAFDIHSGMNEIKWRIFDNYTGIDIDHGTAYLPPQGNAQNNEECTSLYGDYPRGADCYCTPYDGCFHQHFQVKPQIHTGGTNGLQEAKHQGVHDSDYFIEVTATNMAMLQTTKVIKITVDVSPPVAGSVYEGLHKELEIDFQQDKRITVHWKGFFDMESGILLYRYGYGIECLTPDEFDIETGNDLNETYTTEASFEVDQEGKYYVTVAAYNHALDHSIPVCSDGIVVDTTVPTVTEFEVDGSLVDPRLLRSTEGRLWLLHEDRTRQEVENASETCRLAAKEITLDQLQLIPVRRNYRGVAESFKFSSSDDCTKYMVDSEKVLNVVHNWKYISLSWNVTGTKSGIYDFYVGIASTESHLPDLIDFKSSNQHTHLTISHPNLNEGSLFYFIVKSLSRSNVENIQMIGPFLLLTTPPTFDGEIVVKTHHEKGEDFLIASWDESAFGDSHNLVKLDYQFAVGTTKYGTDVNPFSDLNFESNCNSTVPPTCTATPVKELDWDLHHGKEYYITVRVNNTAGLMTKVSSKPYKHNVLPPSAGVVIDIDPKTHQEVKDNDDIDYQKSMTSMSGRWYGFQHFYSSIRYTACITDESGVILKDTCKYVGTDTNTTLEGAQMQVFKKYRVLVTAETDFMRVNASSDGVIVIDPNENLENVTVHDGKLCSGETVILGKEQSHFEQDLMNICTDDITHQASLHKLTTYWKIPDKWKLFIPDLLWHVEERAAVVDYWTTKTEEVHTSSSSTEINVNLPLIPGRSYRFGLKFCAADICFNTLYTNGVIVIPNPPKTGQIHISYSKETRKVEAVVEKFYDADIEELTEAQEVMDFYEWNIADNHAKGRVAQKWIRLDNILSVNKTHAQFAVELEDEIQFTKCWNLLLKGTNKVGLYSILAKNIQPCHEVVKAATVIDCVASHPSKYIGVEVPTIFTGDPVVLGVNEDWAEDDKDYTPYTNIISAVWPKLRYKTYDWAVIEMHNNDPILYYSDNPVLQNPCDSPDSITCNTTDKNYVNVYFDAEPLNVGHRYAVCIHAEATVLVYEYWKEELPGISVCSDGITVDTTPPSPGNVWLYHKEALYQSSNSEVAVYWDRFIDIEELGKHVHESGISHYMVALGSHHGGVDVIPLTDVGICNHFIFHNLKLQDGHSYFATVIGHDFAGRHSNRTSAALIIDTTPPIKSNQGITIGKRFITDRSNIEACWQGVFSDPDSGMADYKWGIGSQPGYDDKYSFSETVNTCSGTPERQSLALNEGHSYFVTVQGFNNAGLFGIATSWAYTVDTTPPVAGYVNDGERKPGGTSFDLDYQTEGSVIFAHWGGFSDPHTALKEFLVSIGTTKGGQDVIDAQSVGLDNDIQLKHLQVRDGMTYYVSVTACNVADLCSTATSDGIRIDSSPPVSGRIIDGTGNKDIRYQASRTFVGAKWFGFTDPQSGLSHFTWRVGTEAFADDIVPAREVHLSEIAVIPDLIRALNKQLPTGKMIYNTIRAYNKGGLFSEASSNGFMVDDTVPTVVMPLTHVPIGSFLPSTSVLRSSLKVKWNVEDSVSFISRQYLSIAAHRGDEFNTSLKIGGLIREYTFTKLTFHDGSLYNVKLIACNGAKLCVSSTLLNLLIDSSPPIAGTFAINTDHSVSHKLDRQPESWMMWESTKIHLAWLGFSDIHSGILEYYFNIGSSFMASDLNENQNQPHVVPFESMREEGGFVQTRTINTQTLKNNEYVFISMWAVNGVGLESEIVHSQFLLVLGGDLQLIRRCSSHTCHGHCVCAAQDLKCATDLEVRSCVNKSGNTTYSFVEVQDVLSPTDDLHDSLTGSHTPTDMMLTAKWAWKSGTKPIWYEWSVGETGYNTPTGVFESQDRTWHDAGRLLSWTFTLPKGSYLLEGERYSFFVRAWFDENTFSDFKSQGVIIQTTAPQTTSLFGKAVKEVRENNINDIDFVKPDDTIFAFWEGKFKNSETSISRYRIFISLEPNGHDIHASKEDIAPHTTRYNLTGVFKEANTRFYTNIIAYNAAGLSTVVSSDGCQIDADIPVSGVVFDGLGYSDRSFQNSTNIVSASWQGFVDFGSSLRSYHWCVSLADSVGSCTALPLQNVGLETRAERKLLSHVTNGIKLVSEIFATDQVGHNSATALSKGVIVDETPPIRLHHVLYGENLLLNPSFENTPSPVSLADLKMNHTCLFNNPPNWIFSDDGCSRVVTAAADMVEDGVSFVAMKGAISQTVSQLNIQSFYRLRFLTSHLPLDIATSSSKEGFVEFGDDKHLFILYSKPRRSDDASVQLSWHLNTFVFKPRYDEVRIKIGSFDNNIGLAIDNVQLQESISAEGNKENKEGHIEVHTVFQHDWSSVHASWNFYDGESGIKEYLWAIGTVQGGIQIQDFKSVGDRVFASNSDLFLPHNATIYVTVVAVNGADIRTVSYSDPIRVDLTPPIFEYVNDGTVEGKNLNYQGSWNIGVNFKIADPESDIVSCSWGIGIQPGDVSLRPFDALPSGLNSAEFSLDRNDKFKTLFVTVRCTNKAGLQTTKSSDGVTILENKPTSDVLAIELLGQSPSQYVAHSHYHGTQDHLRIRLTGFREDQLIDKYKIAIKGPRYNITSYVYDNNPGYVYAKFGGHTFEDGLYNITVMGINRLNVESDPIVTSVTVLTVQPKIKADITMTWDRSLEEVTVSWADVFHSDSPLYYEVSVGSVRGSGDIIQWQETSSTKLVFSLKHDNIGQNGKTIYAVVRAITLSGTYSTAKKDELLTVDD